MLAFLQDSDKHARIGDVVLADALWWDGKCPDRPNWFCDAIEH
jgi:hypothetical protein